MTRDIKKCKQCGEFRNINEYRVYYNKNKVKAPGRYTVCKTCEAINQRHKYLTTKLNKATITETETTERNQIEELYDLLREAGLQPPTRKADITVGVTDTVADLMAKRRAELDRREEVDVELDTPDELVEWLAKDLSNYHPDELEAVSDRLWKIYRPQTGVDPITYNPIKDDTYRDTLNRIQERFDEHEDHYEG